MINYILKVMNLFIILKIVDKWKIIVIYIFYYLIFYKYLKFVGLIVLKIFLYYE